MTEPSEPITRAYGYAGHTVTTPAHLVQDEGTISLRYLIEEVGSVRTVAKMLGIDHEEVATWTREGLPKDQRARVRMFLAAAEGQPRDGLSQNPNYTTDAQFTMMV